MGRLESSGEVTASYATGQVTGDGTKGGLVGSTAGTVSNSYWDSDQSGIAGGKTTSELQSPTTYGATANDTYYNWNANLDGQAGNDDPWTFGAMDQYPALKYADMDTTVQFNLQPVVVTLALTPSSISESGGMSTVTATLSRSLSAATTITVRPVADAYTVPADSTITIAAGSTANASDTVVITSVDNTQDEPNRNVTMSAVMHNSQVSGRVTGTLTITDDDLAPMVTLTPNPASISEKRRGFDGHGVAIASVERGDDDHGAPSGGCLHGGDGFDDHHRGREHGERVGHGGHHIGGQHPRRACSQRDRVRCGEQRPRRGQCDRHCDADGRRRCADRDAGGVPIVDF